MLENKRFSVAREDQSITLKMGPNETPITKPSEFPGFVQGFLAPVIENFEDAFPTCSEELARRKKINFLWQVFAVPKDGQADIEGTTLNEAITDIAANYARGGSSREDKHSIIFTTNSLVTSPKAARIGKKLLKVLSSNLSTQEAMNLLGEALFLGEVDQLKKAYSERKNNKDPEFDDFFQESSTSTNAKNKLRSFLAQGSGGVINGNERSVIFYASIPIAVVAFRMILSTLPFNWQDIPASLILLKSYHYLPYHEVAHALSNVSQADNESFLGVTRNSKKD